MGLIGVTYGDNCLVRVGVRRKVAGWYRTGGAPSVWFCQNIQAEIDAHRFPITSAFPQFTFFFFFFLPPSFAV